MNIRELKEMLRNFPEEMELVCSSTDWSGEYYMEIDRLNTINLERSPFEYGVYRRRKDGKLFLELS